MIDKLDSFPELQKELFEKVLTQESDFKSGSSPMSDELKMKYLALKCELEPDKVCHQLEIFKLPLDKSLQICQKYKNNFAIAYLKSRLGLRQEAVDEYLRVNPFLKLQQF